MAKTYRIEEDERTMGGHAIICLLCGLRSHNPNDVFFKYCGRCHLFHEDERLKALTQRVGEIPDP
jgi:hypothetical protein